MNMRTPPYKSFLSVPEKKYKIWIQIAIAAACGLMDFGSSILFAPHIPLYMDMIFTLFASYFGWIAGIGAAIVHHVCSISAPDGLTSFPFIICSITGVCFIRLWLCKSKKVDALDLVVLTFLMSMTIAIEGGIIYSVLFAKYDYVEHMITKYFTMSLVLQDIPLIISAILARIPTNLLDKTIAVTLSWLMAFAVSKAEAHWKSNARNR